VSGAVGAYGNVDPRVEADVCAALGLEVEPSRRRSWPAIGTRRCCPRSRICGSSLDRLRDEIRHLPANGGREAEEPFAAGQKGSSAMPHKRNPITCERISGLARVLRGNALVGLENVPLWHERDISHSSAERIVLADSTILLDYLLDRFAWVMEGLVVRPEQMRRNIDGSHGLPFSGRVLLVLVEAGADARGGLRRRPARRHAGVGDG
jgi:adenylosuccinate lyase